MVELVKKLAFLCAAVFALNSCRVDLSGLFVSTDRLERWKERDSFRFLTSGDRSRSFGDTYSFIVVTDTHIENGVSWGLERLKDIIDSDPAIRFVAVTGDITQNGAERDLRRFIDIARSLGVPCYPVAGNHDMYFGNWSVWKELIGSTCYRIDGGSATLLVLDSANAYFGTEQLEWLEEQLNSARGRVFVFTHANLFVKSPADEQQFTDVRERARVVSLLKGRCDVMFMGHAHRRIVREAGGVHYVAIEDYRSSRTWLRVSVSPGGVNWEFRTL